MPDSLTPSAIISIITSELDSSGFQRLDDYERDRPSDYARLFEDEYSIVGIVVYETWKSLKRDWYDAQAWLVDILRPHFNREDSKAWDGYLILITPAPTALATSEEIRNITYDTSRVRKLVGTGDRLRTEFDVRRLIQPVMPLDVTDTDLRARDGLELVQEHLPDDIPPHVVGKLIDAYREDRPLMEAVHNARTQQ